METKSALMQGYVNPATKTLAISQLSWSAANALYRNGAGQFDVKVDARNYDFSHVNPNGFNANGRQLYTFPKIQDGLPSNGFVVDGTVTLQLDPGGQTFHVLPDPYDFNLFPWSAQTAVRNSETIIDHFLADPYGIGTPFNIIIDGHIPVPAVQPATQPPLLPGVISSKF